MNLTQPTVSKIIQSLEEELGVLLLCKENGRKKRQVQPTAIGEEVYRHALNLLHERDLLLARVDDYRHVKSGTLRLGLALFGSDLLSHALFDFHHKWPDIELSFLEQGSLATRAIPAQQRTRCRAAARAGSRRLRQHYLCDYPLVVLMPKNRARHDALTLKSLQHEPFTSVRRRLSLNETSSDGLPRIKVLRPMLSAVPDNGNLVADMVAHNMGIALLPEYYARKINPDVFAAIPLVEPEIRWQLTMAWKNTNARRRP